MAGSIAAALGRIKRDPLGLIGPGAIQSLLVDGVIAGVGAVLVFLPQIVILFLFIALLEDMVKAGTISAADLQLFLVTDDLKEALAHIKRHAIEEFGLSPKPPTPSKLLGESAYPIVITDQTP